jgi:hypothetical protein
MPDCLKQAKATSFEAIHYNWQTFASNYSCKTTYPEAVLPTLPNTAFNERQNARLA